MIEHGSFCLRGRLANETVLRAHLNKMLLLSQMSVDFELFVTVSYLFRH